MKTSPNGIKFIEKEEGCILQAYDDYNDKVVKEGQAVKGTLTIGTGHTTSAGAPKVFIGQKITQAQADQILASDLGKVEAQVNNLVKVPLNQNQFDALVSFQFNTGGLAKSSVLRLLNQKNYQGAADALLNWSKANGNPTLLLNRRKRERTLFLTPASAINPHAGAAGTVVVGAAAAYSWPHYLWYIIPVAIVVVGAIYLYEHYSRKQ